MRGEFSGVRQELIDELIASFSWHEAVDSTFYHSLFRDTIPPPMPPLAPEPTALNDEGEIYLPGDIARLEKYRSDLAIYEERKAAFSDAASDEGIAWDYYQKFILDETTDEPAIVRLIERAFSVFEEFGGDDLANGFFNHVARFIEKYSLRYDLRRPFSLHPTLPGVFSRLISDLRQITSQDAALAALMHDFEECVRDLKSDNSPRKVKQCISAQFNLLEALLKQHPDVVTFNATAKRQANTFGVMCDLIAEVWPHAEIKASAKGIYKFANDYPGIRHAGTEASKLREIEMRDMVSVTIMLAAFTPYFTNRIDASRLYLG